MSPALWGAATALSWGSADLIGRWTGTRFGAVVAGLNCQHVGCVPPTRPEVDRALTAT